MSGRLLPSGERAVLVEVDTLDQVLELHRRLWVERREPALLDAVTGARTVLLVAQSPTALPTVRAIAQEALRHLSDGAGAPATDSDAADVRIAVHYDGPDLAEVAELTGLSAAEVVTAHTGRVWRVAFSGFAPGFAYLVGGDARLDVPRRPTPRTRVPAGSVGLAGEFSGIYPRASPGGWQLLGRTEQLLWDLERDPPALLRPGLRVQFFDADGDHTDGDHGDDDHTDDDHTDGDLTDGDHGDDDHTDDDHTDGDLTDGDHGDGDA